MAALAHKTKI